MGVVYRIALVVTIIGALNWGLIGLFQFDLVAYLFGGQTGVLSRWVYALVGIGGLISIPILAKPLDDYEGRSEISDGNSQIYGTPNYNMEAGEEVDFTDLKSSDNPDSTSESKSNQDNKK